MKTILLLSPYWREKHRWMVSSYKLADLWQKLGYRVVVVCMGPKTEREQISDTLTIYWKKDLFLPDPFNTGIAPGFFLQVRKAIKEKKPDIIIINKILFWSTLSIIPLRLLGYNVLLLTDALVGMTWWPKTAFSKVLAALSAWTIGWCMMLCSHRFVTFHPQPPALLKKLGISSKTQVIPTGIDSSLYNSNKRDDQLTITYVGRLESVKGVEDFAAAAAKLKKEYPEIQVQVVGWYKENHPLVTEYQNVIHFTGLREDIPNILAQSDIFVLPSYSEGLSNALMEAMSSSCACIASDVGGNRYLIQNGVSGFLFSPGDRAMLYAHMKRLIDDTPKRKALGHNARERIEKVFDWKIVGAQYKKLFTDHLDNNSVSQMNS